MTETAKKSAGFEETFSRFANTVAVLAGSSTGFVVAFSAMVFWAISGPFFGFSDVWQLAVNTGTTIVTFLMVFLIQHSQNRDTTAIQVKIDELIRATKGASNSLLDLEAMSTSEIQDLHERYHAIAERAKALGYDFDKGSPELPGEVKEAEAEKVATATTAADAKAKRSSGPATAKSNSRPHRISP
jgi:low affinity Fe/Cu permease